MYHVTEPQLKKVGGKFLKDFYKDRPRQGPTAIGYDLTTQGNVIIDGHLSFKEADGKEFCATFEASCMGRKEEVMYKFQKRKIFFESLAISTASVLFGLAVALTYRDYIITFRNLYSTLLYIVSALFVIGVLAAILINRRHRFRYIYAIEQFKRYHADDQWIVIADDVFESPQDKYLLELKKQCIKGGFGLISVNQHLEGYLMIVPCRIDLFANRRQKVGSVDNGIMQKLKVNKLTNAFARFKNSFKNIFKRKTKNTTSTRRFINHNYWPTLTSFLSMLAIGCCFYFQLRDTSKVFVKDELGYRNDLSKVKGVGEAQNYLIDTLAMENYPLLGGIRGSLSDLEFLEDTMLPQSLDELSNVFDYDESDGDVKFLISVKDGSYFTYDCERLFHFRGTNYLLQDNVFKLWSNAFNRIRFLKKKGIYAHAIQTSCLANDKPEYIVFYEIIFDKKREAEAAFPEYIGELESANIFTSKATIRELQF